MAAVGGAGSEVGAAWLVFASIAIADKAMAKADGDTRNVRFGYRLLMLAFYGWWALGCEAGCCFIR